MNNIFDWLKEINSTKSHPDSFTNQDWDVWNSYMVHRFLSMNPDYIELVNETQILPPTNKKQIYSIYREMLPKRKVYLKWIGSKKKSKNKTATEYIAKYFECGLGEAEEYIDILREIGTREILYKMGVDDKEADKLLK